MTVAVLFWRSYSSHASVSLDADGVADDVAHLRGEQLAALLLAELGGRPVAQVADLALVDLHVELLRLRIAEVDGDGGVAVVEVRVCAISGVRTPARA